MKLTLVGMFALLMSGASLAQTPVERGSYLVNSILTCANCHSPRKADGSIDQTRQFSGGPQTWDEPSFKVKGANITPDPETGIGKWSADDIKRALRLGVRPDGTQIAPIMPTGFYKIFTDADVDAVVAYLRSVPAVHNAVTPPIYKAPMHSFTPPLAARAMRETALKDPLKRGFYLVTLGHCMECHTPKSNGHFDAKRLGTGGQNFAGPWGVSVSRNITSHRVAGLGAWSDAEIKRAITHGVRNDGTPLKPPMGFEMYANLSDPDLDAIVAYLRTVPAKQ